MRLTQVEVSGLRGRDVVVDLDDLTVIRGPNGAGKTTVAEGVLLALTQRLPGRDVDKQGMATVGPLLDLTADRPWTVTARDNDGYAVAFGFRPSEAAGTRQVFPPAHGEPGPAGDNAAAREAVAKRYGGTLGVALLDLEGLRRMEPVALERAVLALCSGSSTWTPRDVLNALVTATMDRVKPDTLDRAELSEDGLAALLEPAVDAVEGPLDAVDQIGRYVGAQRTQANSDVRSTRALIDAPIPDAPDAATMQRVTDACQTAELAAATAKEQLGGARQRVASLEEQRASWESERRKRQQMAQAAVDAAESRAREAVREYEQAEHSIEASRAQIRRIEEDLIRRASDTGLGAELLKARTERDRAQVALDASGRRLSEAEEAWSSARDALERARRAASTARAALDRVDGALRDALRNHGAYADGRCPTCRQDLPDNFDTGHEQVEALHVEADEAAMAHERAETLLREAQAAEHAAEGARSDAQRSRRAAEDALRGAERAVSGLEKRAASGADTDQARLEGQRDSMALRVEDLARELESLRSSASRSTSGVIEARRCLEAIRQESCPVEDAPVRRALDEAELRARQADMDLRQARAARTEADARTLAREEAVARKAEAERARQVAQAWHEIWRAAEAELPGVQAEATAGVLSPLTGPVQKMASAFASQLGSFAVESGGRPRIGWRRGPVVVPLSALSAGEAALTLLMVAAAMHHLANSPLRLVVVDGAEVLDRHNQVAFARLAERLVGAGRLDQVLVCTLPGGTWDGWTVVDMTAPEALEEAA